MMPRNIIHIGGKYTWEEVDELLNSNVKNKFTISRNGQIVLTTKVVTIKELMKPDMFDAEGEKRRLVYKYGQATKFTIGVVNEAVSGERRQVELPDGTEVEMVIDFTILSLSTTYGDFNKNHSDFAARGDSGGDQRPEARVSWTGHRRRREGLEYHHHFYPNGGHQDGCPGQGGILFPGIEQVNFK